MFIPIDKDTAKLFAGARKELAERKVNGVGLGRSWMLIDLLFQELDAKEYGWIKMRMLVEPMSDG